jgi:NAD(P)-dependent dehydrogenase (short-subunit alcohol dehydrogenase family)
MSRLAGRLALVTGASRGIGYAVAKRYAAEGAHVIAVARTQGGLEQLDDEIRGMGGSATLLVMDLSKHEQIDGLAAPLLERWGRLDVLVANAGMLGRLTPIAQFPPNLWQQCFDLNVHANWRLIRALDPLLRASPSGRAMLVTSGVTQRPAPYWGAYAVTKAALEAMAQTWAAELEQTNLRVNLINPGPVRTMTRAQAYPGEDPAALPAPDQVTEAFVMLAEASCTLHGARVEAQDFSSAGKTTH